MLDSEPLRRDLAGSSSVRCTRLCVSLPFDTIYSYPPPLQITQQMDDNIVRKGSESTGGLLFRWIVGSGRRWASVLSHVKPICIVVLPRCISSLSRSAASFCNSTCLRIWHATYKWILSKQKLFFVIYISVLGDFPGSRIFPCYEIPRSSSLGEVARCIEISSPTMGHVIIIMRIVCQTSTGRCHGGCSVPFF